MSAAGAIAERVNAGRLSAADAAREALGAIKSRDGSVRAFLEVFEGDGPGSALAQARRVDERVAAGERLPLAGVPVAVKDNICLEWGKTTCASRMLEGYRSPFTATAARKLIEAGAVVVGKTNMDEFAMGSSTERSAFFPTRNPWDETRVPGGSSGGSAAAVAAGMTPIALGSDTGGSIRQPAALCGVVGVKPTYGRVSRYGLVAYASSLDQIGPMAGSVADAGAVLEAICGHDERDTTSALHAVPRWTHEIEKPVEGLTIGVPRQARSEANHPAVTRVFEEAIAAYRGMGATIVDIDLELADAGIAAYYVVALAEASSNLARFDGVRYGRRAALAPGEGLMELYTKSRGEGLGEEVKRRVMLGTHVLSSGYYDAYYTTALKARRKILDEFKRAFGGLGASGGAREPVHAVIMPTTPGPAFKIGEKSGANVDPKVMYLEDVYTVGVNLAGLPAMSVPGGFAEVGGKRLPLGVQVVCDAFDEGTMLRVGRMLERAKGAHGEWPVGSGR